MKRLLILTFLVATSSQAAGIKKWIDDNGQIHYGDSPPVKTKIEDIRVSRPPSDPGKPLPRLSGQKPAATGQQQQAGTQQQGSDAPQYTEEQSKELCERAKKDQNTLNTSDTIRLRSSDGKIRVMSDAEKAERKAQAQKDIDQFCQ
jgi:hypothetical protein